MFCGILAHKMLEGLEPVERDRHWDGVYRRGGPGAVTWYQDQPTVSTDLIDSLQLRRDAAIVDIGGGTSTLVDALLAAWFSDLTVLDVSSAALDETRSRLGNQAASITWLHQDLLAWEPPTGRYDLWHDRAVFHFLVKDADRDRYRQLVHRALRPGGHVVIGTFAPDGPTHCSGLPVLRYNPDELHNELGPTSDLIAKRRQEHTTPAGAIQPFTWAVMRFEALNH